jgi:uncharacterized damage-inducible protein DinB
VTEEQQPESIAADVDAILEDNQRARAELLEAIDGLPAGRRLEPWFGEWSVHDIVAHIYMWQNGFAHALECIARGERPEVPDYDPQSETGTDDFNAMAVEQNKHLSWEELLAHLRAARERHEAAVRNLVGTVPPDRFAQGRSARRLASSATHDDEHIGAILDWRRERGV